MVLNADCAPLQPSALHSLVNIVFMRKCKRNSSGRLDLCMPHHPPVGAAFQWLGQRSSPGSV